MPQIVNAQPHHIAQLLAKPLDPTTAASWTISSGGRPIAEMLQQIAGLPSSYLRALLNDANEAVVLWGAYEHPEGFGSFWAINTLEADQHRHFARTRWRDEVTKMHRLFGRLGTTCYNRNEMHLRWLLATGFKPIGEVRSEPHPVPFTVFVRELPACARQ